MSVNKVILIGNLGQNPEVKYMSNGEAVSNISIATSKHWKDKNTGENKESTEWHRVVFFKRLAEITGEYLKKGSKIYVEGELKTRKWQDSEGKDRYTTEIIGRDLQMLGSNESKPDAPAGNIPASHNVEPLPQAGASSGSPYDDFDDDIPF